jgi:hypothetical protein
VTTGVGKLAHRFKQGSKINYLLPRFEDILFLAVFLSVIGLGPRLLNMDGDLGRHLTIGNYILDNLTIPTRDIFSHTMEGVQLTPHEWVGQVIFALSYRLAGLDGVVLVCALLLATTFTLVFRQSMQYSNLLLLSLGITILAAAAASLHWLARPHLFSLLFTVLWIGEMELMRRSGRIRWWSLPLLMFVWVNIHGAFIIGFVIWGAYLIDSFLSSWKNKDAGEFGAMKNIWQANFRLPRDLILIGLVLFCLSFANPAGWRIWETTVGFLGNRYLVSHTIEYLPPDFQAANSWPFLFMIIASILLASVNSRKITIASALLISAWTAMGLISARNIPVYAVIAAPIIARLGSSILEDKTKVHGLFNFDLRLRNVDLNLVGHLWPMVCVVLVGASLIGGVNLDFNRSGNEFSPEIFPVKAVNWLNEGPIAGQVFNYFPWGGYLLYRTWPEQRVFIDGQTDFYGESLTRQYEHVITLSDGWEEVLSRYKVNWVIMPQESQLVETLKSHPGWQMRYQDETAAILQLVP